MESINKRKEKELIKYLLINSCQQNKTNNIKCEKGRNIEGIIVEKSNYYEDDDYRDEIAGASKIFNEENSEKKGNEENGQYGKNIKNKN